MRNIKAFAMYLPQYHETEENSKFWGKGFTDWVSARNATSLFDGHLQPQKPLNDFYYDLSKKEDIKWQADLAKEYGVSGWGIYHYWFNNEQRALTKPAELILNNKDIDIPFFFAWDNASWKRTWSKIKGNDWSPLVDQNSSKKGPEILFEYILGTEEDWKVHFEYLLPYFKDSRYVKDNGSPLFLLYNYSDGISEMAKYWNKLAIEAGFSGIKIVLSYNPLHGIPKNCYKFRYEPLYSGWGGFFQRVYRKVFSNKTQTEVKKFDYDKVWTKIIANAKRCKDPYTYYGAFVNYDDTPRRGERGKVILQSSPEKFKAYLSKLAEVCDKQGKEYIFLTAWNEWGEGACLEPNATDKYDYLEAYKEVFNNR